MTLPGTCLSPSLGSASSVWASFPDRLSHWQQQVYILPCWQQMSRDWGSLEQHGPVPVPGQGEGMLGWAKPRWGPGFVTGEEAGPTQPQHRERRRFPKGYSQHGLWRERRWRLAEQSNQQSPRALESFIHPLL